jgi:uncharacterized protein
MEHDRLLSDEEIRVLGALIEKSRTTPEYYPMTVNAIMLACNQKSSRKPVVEYSEETVLSALASLKGRSLVATAVGGTARSVKYKHNFHTVYPVSDAGLAVLCLLFLRGPLTPGELNSNSGRLYEFSSLAEVLEALQSLASREIPLVQEMERKAGQKERRFRHLFRASAEDEEELTAPAQAQGQLSLAQRVETLEAELAEMKQIVEKLKSLID